MDYTIKVNFLHNLGYSPLVIIAGLVLLAFTAWPARANGDEVTLTLIGQVVNTGEDPSPKQRYEFSWVTRSARSWLKVSLLTRSTRATMVSLSPMCPCQQRR